MVRGSARRILSVLGLPTAALLAAGHIVWSLEGSASSARAAYSLAVVLAGQALGGVTALIAARRLGNTPASRVWRFLAAAWLLWCLASTLNGGAWVLWGRLPNVPSVVDLLELAGSFSFVWALATYPVNPPERYGKLREFLDVVVLTIGVLTLVWLSLLRPVFAVLRTQSILVIWAGIRLAAAAVAPALALRVVLLAGPRRESRALLLLGGSTVMSLATSLAWAYWTVTDGFVPGGIQDLFPMGAAFLGIAAASATAPLTSATPGGSGTAQRGRLEALLPIALTYAVVGFTVLDASLAGAIDPAGLGASITLSVLLVARQGVMAGQNEMRQYAALLNASGDLAFICDGEGRLRYFNPAFADALGLEVGPPRSTSLGKFLPSADSLTAVLGQAGTTGWTGETVLRRKDGTSFPARLTLRPVGSAASDGLVAGTGIDLTVIRARETELRGALQEVAAARSELEALNLDLEHKVEARTAQLARMVEDLDRLNKQLKELDKLKSEFVALVSHELRAPLTNIRGGLELLLDAEPTLNTHVRESLSLVDEEATRLGRFVEAILDLSALEAGRFPLRPAPVSPWKAAQLAIDRFRGHPAYPQMRLSIAPETPDVLADERALGSVFFHLLDNAVKYGGWGPIRVGGRAADEQVEFEIEDTGPGIPEAERERAFEMFHRLDARDDREVYGHGLGLHLVRRMLEAMAGTIRVETGLAGGTKMVFTLPRADAEPAPMLPSASAGRDATTEA